MVVADGLGDKLGPVYLQPKSLSDSQNYAVIVVISLVQYIYQSEIHDCFGLVRDIVIALDMYHVLTTWMYFWMIYDM